MSCWWNVLLMHRPNGTSVPGLKILGCHKNRRRGHHRDLGLSAQLGNAGNSVRCADSPFCPADCAATLDKQRRCIDPDQCVVCVASAWVLATNRGATAVLIFDSNITFAPDETAVMWGHAPPSQRFRLCVTRRYAEQTWRIRYCSGIWMHHIARWTLPTGLVLAQ